VIGRKVEFKSHTNELRYPLILSSYKMLEHCKKSYPKRNIVADMYIDHDDFYYWNRKNELRLVRNGNELWIAIDWPYIKRRQPK
jgi:hypothetical protein